MTPPTISPEARKCWANLVASGKIQDLYPSTPHSLVLQEIQLAINTSAEALAKENAELREANNRLIETFEGKYEPNKYSFWMDSYFAAKKEYRERRDLLQARVAELELQLLRDTECITRCQNAGMAAEAERDSLTARLATMEKLNSSANL